MEISKSLIIFNKIILYCQDQNNNNINLKNKTTYVLNLSTITFDNLNDFLSKI